MKRLTVPILVFIAALASACSGSSQTDLAATAADGGGTPESALNSYSSVAPAAAARAAGSPAAAVPAASGPGAGAPAAPVLSAAAPSLGGSGYRIGPFDVLEIQVFKVPELSKTVQVSEAGTINYPLIGEISAAGRSARQVEQSLTHALGANYLRDPQVSVYVREYNSQRVTLEGAVEKPGVYPIRGDMTLLQLLATAGGLNTISDDTVVVFRNVNAKRTVARFDVEPIREGTAPDPKLAAGDTVIVGKSSLKEGFGNVMKAVPLVGVFTLL